MRKFLIGLSFVISGVIIGIVAQPLISGDSIFNQLKKFESVLSTAQKNYVDEVDTEKLVESAIVGMLNELDPHSVYIDAKEMQGVTENFQGSFEGIGVEFDIVNDTLVIVSPIPGGPSEALGIMSGDKIVKIDGQSSVGITRSEVPKKLRGPKGTQVVIEIMRGNLKSPISYTITRDKIPLNSVDASFIVDGTDVGVIAINRFSATTYEEMMDALGKLKGQGMKKLILDLRYNPGGYMNQAVMMANEFLGSGDTIVYTKGRRPQFDETHIANGLGDFKNTPIIVLINAGSASASEILSGAVQDHDRGLIVGETSFGKGLVQRQFEVGDGSAYRLTISRYYTPSGRSIQRPYEDKDAYRSLAGRLELEEGLNLEHALEKVKNDMKKDGSNENFDTLLHRTRAGRKVLGGGGITPDYIIKQDTITKLSASIRQKNIFFEYVNSLLESPEGEKIKSLYKNNFSSFLRNYRITPQMMGEFRKIAEKKGVTWNDAEAKTDASYLDAMIKATIARSVWDREKYLQIFYTVDNQFIKTLGLFPEAVKVSQLK